jgi:hypothetical protein
MHFESMKPVPSKHQSKDIDLNALRNDIEKSLEQKLLVNIEKIIIKHKKLLIDDSSSDDSAY